MYEVAVNMYDDFFNNKINIGIAYENAGRYGKNTLHLLYNSNHLRA